MSKTIEKMIKDVNYVKVAESAAFKYRKSLSPDEIQNCIYNAMWKASKSYKDNQGKKLTSFLHDAVSWECLNSIRFNTNKTISLDSSQSATSIRGKFNDFEEIDMLDEIRNCGDADLVYGRFYLGKSLRELADERGVCGQMIRSRLEKCLKNIKLSLNG